MTCSWMTRAPFEKSERFFSIPESTTAIVGGLSVPLLAAPQNRATAATCAHFCLFE